MNISTQLKASNSPKANAGHHASQGKTPANQTSQQSNFDSNGKIILPPPPLTDEQILKTGSPGISRPGRLQIQT